DTNNRQDADIPDQTFANAGGAVNNTTAKLLVCYATSSGAADSAIIPVSHHDFVATTDGNDLEARINTDGFYRAA
ncbi:MAG: hypothetical protein ACR2QF_15580, partial [Geminicoccaceae bacterium]